MLLAMHGRPALAIASVQVAEVLSTIVHTAADRPEVLDATNLATIALALRDVLSHLSEMSQ
jgi:hypothetical protein